MEFVIVNGKIIEVEEPKIIYIDIKEIGKKNKEKRLEIIKSKQLDMNDIEIPEQEVK